MATLSAIFQISCLLHLGQKGGERGRSVGDRYHKLGQYCAFFFSFFVVVVLPILIWNGVNSQSKNQTNHKYKKNKNSIETERHRGNIDPPKKKK